MHRLTITLDDDLYAMARSHAVARKTSISKAIADLMLQRQRQKIAAPESAENTCLHPLSGFPVSASGGRPFTHENVRRMEDDEDVRILEGMGLTRDQVRESLER